jgi:glycosyltransferase involved in cell wall biosynthesis
MRLIYIVNSRIPTERAYGWAISKMCSEFAKLGLEVLLLVPKDKRGIKEDLFTYYDLPKNFKVKEIFNINLVGRCKSVRFLPKLFFLIQNISFLLSSLFVRTQKDDLIYLRNIENLLFWPLKNKNIFFEIHQVVSKKDRLFLPLIKKAKKIIVITQRLKNEFIDYRIPEEKILVAPDAVDLGKFDINVSQKECRQKFNLPLDKKIIIYTGHLYKENGVYTLAQAGKWLVDGYLIVFVGGMEGDVKKLRSYCQKLGLDNILLVGHQPHKVIPYWLKAADILVMPYSARHQIAKYYMSSLKMFEYMASKRPIISSDLPSVREVLNKNNAYFVKADDPKSLAEGIEKCLINREFSAKLAEQAYLDVQEYTWPKRAQKIYNFISK